MLASLCGLCQGEDRPSRTEAKGHQHREQRKQTEASNAQAASTSLGGIGAAHAGPTSHVNGNVEDVDTLLKGPAAAVKSPFKSNLGHGSQAKLSQPPATQLPLPSTMSRFRAPPQPQLQPLPSSSPTAPSLLLSEPPNSSPTNPQSFVQQPSPQLLLQPSSPLLQLPAPSVMSLRSLLAEVQLQERLGAGAYGTTWKCRWRTTTVAIKLLVSSSVDELRSCTREAVCSRLVSHPCVVQCYAINIIRLSEQDLDPAVSPQPPPPPPSHPSPPPSQPLPPSPLPPPLLAATAASSTKTATAEAATAAAAAHAAAVATAADADVEGGKAAAGLHRGDNQQRSHHHHHHNNNQGARHEMCLGGNQQADCCGEHHRPHRPYRQLQPEQRQEQLQSGKEQRGTSDGVATAAAVAAPQATGEAEGTGMAAVEEATEASEGAEAQLATLVAPAAPLDPPSLPLQGSAQPLPSAPLPTPQFPAPPPPLLPPSPSAPLRLHPLPSQPPLIKTNLTQPSRLPTPPAPSTPQLPPAPPPPLPLSSSLPAPLAAAPASAVAAAVTPPPAGANTGSWEPCGAPARASSLAWWAEASGSLMLLESDVAGEVAAEADAVLREELRRLGAAPGKYLTTIIMEWCDGGTLHDEFADAVPPGSSHPPPAARSGLALSHILRGTGAAQAQAAAAAAAAATATAVGVATAAVAAATAGSPHPRLLEKQKQEVERDKSSAPPPSPQQQYHDRCSLPTACHRPPHEILQAATMQPLLQYLLPFPKHLPRFISTPDTPAVVTATHAPATPALSSYAISNASVDSVILPSHASSVGPTHGRGSHLAATALKLLPGPCCVAGACRHNSSSNCACNIDIGFSVIGSSAQQAVAVGGEESAGGDESGDGARGGSGANGESAGGGGSGEGTGGGGDGGARTGGGAIRATTAASQTNWAPPPLMPDIPLAGSGAALWLAPSLPLSPPPTTAGAASRETSSAAATAAPAAAAFAASAATAARAAAAAAPAAADASSRMSSSRMAVLLRCALEVAQGMAYLHSMGLAHGDLTPKNVLLKSTATSRRGYQCKISDFGLSHPAATGDSLPSDTAKWGTLAYMAPEILNGTAAGGGDTNSNTITDNGNSTTNTSAANVHACSSTTHGGGSTPSSSLKQADVYSFGALLWYMYTGRPPFQQLRPAQLLVGLATGELKLAWPTGTDPWVARVGAACMHPDPNHRPPFEEVVRMLLAEMTTRSRSARRRAAAAAEAAEAASNASASAGAAEVAAAAVATSSVKAGAAGSGGVSGGGDGGGGGVCSQGNWHADAVGVANVAAAAAAAVAAVERSHRLQQLPSSPPPPQQLPYQHQQHRQWGMARGRSWTLHAVAPRQQQVPLPSQQQPTHFPQQQLLSPQQQQPQQLMTPYTSGGTSATSPFTAAAASADTRCEWRPVRLPLRRHMAADSVSGESGIESGSGV